MAHDTAQATQRADRGDRRTGAKWPRTPHTQHNAPSGQICEQERRGPGQGTLNTLHRAGTTVNRSQVAQDNAHAKQRTDGAHR